MSNEKEIRNLFKEIYSKEYPYHMIVDEFNSGTMKTRADLAIFGNTFINMVEIKSDKDTLDRLQNQLYDYSLYSNRVLVILDISHKEKYMKNIKKYKTHHNIMFYNKGSFCDDMDNKINDFVIIFYEFYNSIKYFKLKAFEMLWSDEKKQLVKFIKGRSKFPADDIIKEVYTYNEIKRITASIIYRRIQNRLLANTKLYEHGKVDELEIEHKGIKQQLFDLNLKKR